MQGTDISSQYCHAYNDGACKQGDACMRIHRCSQCNDTHPKSLPCPNLPRKDGAKGRGKGKKGKKGPPKH